MKGKLSQDSRIVPALQRILGFGSIRIENRNFRKYQTGTSGLQTRLFWLRSTNKNSETIANDLQKSWNLNQKMAIMSLLRRDLHKILTLQKHKFLGLKTRNFWFFLGAGKSEGKSKLN